MVSINFVFPGRRLLLAAVLCAFGLPPAVAQEDPLPAWHEADTKRAIIRFVQSVVDASAPTHVPAEERIAVFDNDGTLWSEQPMYFQALYALDRIRSLADDNPQWREREPYKSAMAGDLGSMMAGGSGPVLDMLFQVHAGVSSEEFHDSVAQWLATARHPDTGMRYLDMVYRPMLELLDYLRANDFRVYIVSGGGIDFLRVFAEARYGVPPEQVVGTTLDARYELRDGVPTIIKEDGVSLVDDRAGKPVGIYRHIGRRPIFAAGNSDGDLAMLEYTTIPRGKEDTTPSLGLLIHHTDEEREFAYDRSSHVGRLDRGFTQARELGWLLVDMKTDWRVVYGEGGG